MESYKESKTSDGENMNQNIWPNLDPALDNAREARENLENISSYDCEYENSKVCWLDSLKQETFGHLHLVWF